MARTAVVAGVSGIGGSYTARELLARGWTVYGLARRPPAGIPGLLPVAADLLDPAGLRAAVADIAPTHVFITTWMRQATEADNIRVNAGMVRNLLDALSSKGSLRHVALVTGLKHYLGPFEAYAASGTLPDTPLRESQPRLPVENFYYAQEDEVHAAASDHLVGVVSDNRGCAGADPRERAATVGHQNEVERAFKEMLKLGEFALMLFPGR